MRLQRVPVSSRISLVPSSKPKYLLAQNTSRHFPLGFYGFHCLVITPPCHRYFISFWALYFSSLSCTTVALCHLISISLQSLRVSTLRVWLDCFIGTSIHPICLSCLSCLQPVTSSIPFLGTCCKFILRNGSHLPCDMVFIHSRCL
jgi:hypothetical protein